MTKKHLFCLFMIFFLSYCKFPATTMSHPNTDCIYAVIYAHIYFTYGLTFAQIVFAPSRYLPLITFESTKNKEAIGFLSPLNVMSIKFHSAPHSLTNLENHKQHRQQQSQTNEAEVNIYQRIFVVCLYFYLKAHLQTFNTGNGDCLISFLN